MRRAKSSTAACLRVQQARGEAPWLYQTGQSVTRAYRSRIDGSIQPYAVAFPADYGKDRLQAARRCRAAWP